MYCSSATRTKGVVSATPSFRSTRTHDGHATALRPFALDVHVTASCNDECKLGLRGDASLWGLFSFVRSCTYGHPHTCTQVWCHRTSTVVPRAGSDVLPPEPTIASDSVVCSVVALTRPGVVSTAQQKMAVLSNDTVVRVGVRFGCIADLAGVWCEQRQPRKCHDQFLTTTTSTVHTCIHTIEGVLDVIGCS